jgi:FKBP-type peptidyl-prolyl cis-trans isomerase SlyD
MTETNLIVAEGVVVNHDFTLRLDDKRTVATSEGQEPLVFLQGHSQIMPALQQALIGMSVGDEKDVVVAPADGYGEWDSDAFELVPLDTFPPELALTQGLGIKMRDQSGRVHKVQVSDIRPVKA